MTRLFYLISAIVCLLAGCAGHTEPGPEGLSYECTGGGMVVRAINGRAPQSGDVLVHEAPPAGAVWSYGAEGATLAIGNEPGWVSLTLTYVRAPEVTIFISKRQADGGKPECVELLTEAERVNP